MRESRIDKSKPMRQPSLFDPRSDLEKAFVRYHEENPHVYQLFVKYANEVKSKGYDYFSAKAIFERIRWHMAVETAGDQWKLNNNYTAFYARKMMQEYPAFRGFFETREQRAI